MNIILIYGTGYLDQAVARTRVRTAYYASMIMKYVRVSNIQLVS